ncbi:MAG: ferric reductase-like transmembrane domain-containing protein [Planctomycetota bacterium]
MTAAYKAVQWNAHKRTYDLILVGALALFLIGFVAVGSVVNAGDNAVSPEILLIRALGVAAIALLHLTLAIGPLARLDKRFTPLLYNRRHMGVTLFLLAFGHAALSNVWYHGFGTLDPITSIFANSRDYTSLARFPFQPLGAMALVILFVMAATSHDFWLANLGPRAWKALHMSVYGAYFLLVGHVALGALQTEKSWLYPALLGLGMVALVTLHLSAGFRARREDRHTHPLSQEGWIDAGDISDLPDGHARSVRPAKGERIALYRCGDKLAAVGAVCAHQAGPLDEGRVVNGCITCPWHGYQYRPEDGQSPPPYSEKLPTYEVRVEGTRAYVRAQPVGLGAPRDMPAFPSESPRQSPK